MVVILHGVDDDHAGCEQAVPVVAFEGLRFPTGNRARCSDWRGIIQLSRKRKPVSGGVCHMSLLPLGIRSLALASHWLLRRWLGDVAVDSMAP